MENVNRLALIKSLARKEKSTLPPNAHRNARHRKLWIDRSKVIRNEAGSCCICSCVDDLVIHHLYKSAYEDKNFHYYESLDPILPFVVVCRRCHFLIHANKADITFKNVFEYIRSISLKAKDTSKEREEIKKAFSYIGASLR